MAVSTHLVVAELYLRSDHEELKGQNIPEQMLLRAVVGRGHMTPLLLMRRDLHSQRVTVYLAAGAELNVKCGCRRLKELNYKQR